MTKKYKCRVEYLESTGTQWIDTGFNVDTSTDEIKLYFQLNETQNYKWLFGEYDTNARLGLGSGDGTDKRNFLYQQTATKVTDTQMYNKQHLFEINSNGGFLDGTKIRDYLNFASTATIYLFNLNIDSASDYRCKSKIWGYRHKRNGVLILDLIPVLDNSGRPAMYDKVSGQLFYNEDSGDDFSYGRQIIPVEYLESTGTQYIDTGIKGKNNIDFDYKCIFTNLDGTAQCVGGNWSGSSTSTVSLYLGLIRTNGNFAYHYDGTQSPVVVMNTTVQDTPYTVQGRMRVGEQYMVINGTKSSVGTISSTFTSSLNMYLFGINNNGLSNPAYMKLYYCKIYDNGVLVRDLIPCIDENFVPFMFDKVQNTVYLNAGTGQFKFGPNVEKAWGSKKLRKKLALMLANLKKKRKYYCEVEYLETTNQQSDDSSTNAAAYIDTGIIPNNNTRIECRMQFTTLISGNSREALNGTTGAESAPRFAWGFASISPYTNFYFGLGAQNITTSVTRDTNVHTFILDAKNKNWAIDDTSGSFTSSGSLNGTKSIYLFARHNSQNYANKPCNAKVYRCQIWDNGVLVQDLIPILDWNMTPCMFDRVTEQLFYSQGTEGFTAGREIHYVDYLESTGTQYIDTGFKANTTTTKYQTKITPTNITTTQALFGSRNTVNIANTNNCEVFIYQSQFRLDWVNGDGSRGLFVPLAVNTPYEIEVTRGRGVVNGVVYTSTEHTSANQEYNFLIGNFTNGSSTPFSGGFIGKLYYGKLYSNDVLVRDYIPAIDENGVGYMFDRVSHTIYDNAGTGAFKYPPVELEYLKSDGTQYIDTGYYPNLNTKVEFMASGISADSFSSSSTGTWFTGGRQAYQQKMFGSHYNPSTQNLYFSFSTSQTNSSYSSSNMYGDNKKFTLDKTGLYINDTKVVNNTNTTKFTSPATLAIFALNNNGTALSFTGYKLQYYKLWDNNTLTRDFIPAYKDGALGVFDKVNSVFYLNAGTGTFTRGKIVEPEYE